jgi:hypothetical protein
MLLHILHVYTITILTRQYSILDIFTYSNFEIKLLTACRHIRLETELLVEFKVTLRLTVSQSVSLGVETHLGLTTRYLLLIDSYVLFFVRRPL